MLKPVLQSFSLLTRTEKTIFLGLVTGRVVSNLLDLVGLLAVGVVASYFAAGATESSTVQVASIRLNFEDLPPAGGLLLIVASAFALKSVIGLLILRAMTRFLAKVEARSAKEAVQSLFGTDLPGFQKKSVGDIQWSIAESTKFAFSNMLFSASALVSEGTLFIFLVFGLLSVSTYVTLGVVIYFTLVVAVFQLVVNNRLRRLGERLATRSVYLQNAILSAVGAYREILVMKRTKFFFREIVESRALIAQDQGLQRFVMAFPRYFVEVALIGGVVLLLFFQLSTGNLSEAAVVVSVFLAGGARIMAALLPLQNAISDIRITAPQALRAQELLREVAASRNPVASTEFRRESVEHDFSSSGGPTIVVSELSYASPDDESFVLRNISLKVRPNSVTAILGPSGSGKSTLVELILGLRQPTSGTVQWNGVSPRSFASVSNKNVAYVPQRPVLIPGSVRDNIIFGGSDHSNFDQVWWALAEVGLKEFVESLPGQLMHNLGQQGQKLSGGQLQRIGLARALFSGPAVLVLDEYTSALDSRSEATVTAAIKRFSRNATVIIVSHKLSTVRLAKEGYVLSGGRIQDSGNVAELVARGLIE